MKKALSTDNVIQNRSQKVIKWSSQKQALMLTVFVTMGYFLVVAKTALLNAEEAIRYEMPIYGLLILAMWFFFMRPQKKEQKRVAAMLSALEAGDCVLTSSGFYGVVIDIDDDTVIVEFGNNKNCRIPMQKAAISRVEKAE